jgi:hypothetical protein
VSQIVAPAVITLEWPTDPAFRAVGRLVLGGVAARTNLPVDRINELGLAIEALARVPTAEDRLKLEIVVEDARLVAYVGAFSSDPLADPAIRRVVDALVDEAGAVERTGGRWVELSLRLPDGG